MEPEVTNVYADALISAARKKNLLSVISEEGQNLVDLLNRDRKLCLFFEAPHIPTQSKLDFVEKLFRPRLQPLLCDFALFLIQKGRVEYLHDILERYLYLVQIERGIHPALITTAREVSFPERLRLKSELERFTTKQLEITYRVDSGILGGVVFSVQDLLIDDSLRGHLKRLHDQLHLVKVH